MSEQAMHEPAAGPVDEATRNAVAMFLFHEAELLDDRRFEEWLALMTEDVHYHMPLRVTRPRRGGEEFVPAMGHFDDTLEMLTMRVRRLRTATAWAEDPPSRTRHFVSNIRVAPAERPHELAVRSNLLLYRNRGDSAGYDLLSAERHDRLRRVDGELRLAAREIRLDQAALGTLNLSVFL